MGWLSRAAGSAVLLPVAGVALGLASAALVATMSASEASAAPTTRGDRAAGAAERHTVKRAALGTLKAAGPGAAGRRLRVVRPRPGARMSGRTRVLVTSPRMTGVRRVELKVGGRLIARLRPADGVFTGAAGWLDADKLHDGGTELTVLVHRARTRSIVRRPVAVVGSDLGAGVKAFRRDTIAPAAAIQKPAAGEVRGKVAFRATASDASGVASVVFKVDDTVLWTDVAPPYGDTRLWNSASVWNGPHILSIVATDTKGNRRTVRRSVTVSNPKPAATTPKAPTSPTTPKSPNSPTAPTDTTGPRIVITSPSSGAEVSGTTTIAADASDLSGVASVRFSVAGTTIGTDTQAPYAVLWNTAATGIGHRQITALATDTRGNTGTVTRTVEVLNATAPPSTPPTSPGGGDVVPGTQLWTGDFESSSLSQWNGIQRIAPDRIQAVSAPVAQGAFSARFEVRQGDVWQGSTGNRAELMRKTEERQGDERWYSWSTMFAPGFPNTSVGWQIFTQWHASAGGTQSPVVFYVSGDKIGFKTVESDASGTPKPSVVHWTGPIDRGAWHTFRLHIKWSDTASTGWLELWHNGVQVVKRTPVASLIPGQGVYLKQGLYRSSQIPGTAVLYHDGMRMTSVN